MRPRPESARQLRWLLAVIFVVGAATPPASAQLVDDHSPWWLWADRWRGSFTFEEETHATGLVDAGRVVNGTLVLDHREVTDCTTSWVGKYRNTANIVSNESGRMEEHNEVARLSGSSSSSAEGSFPLAPRSGVTISLERGAYKVFLAASADAKVEGNSGVTASAEISGFSDNVGWTDGGEVEVGFARQEYAAIPKDRGPLEDVVEEEHRDGGDSFHSEFRWSFEPEYDIEMWVYRYSGLLETQRRTFRNQQRATIAACDEGTIEGPACRLARADLNTSDRMIARLADDCRRILGKLLKAECPGFALAMRRTFSALAFEDAVCTSPAATCDAIHHHVWDQLDSGRTGDDIVDYNNLPNHLYCLYTFEEFKQVAVYSGTDFISQALPH